MTKLIAILGISLAVLAGCAQPGPRMMQNDPMTEKGRMMDENSMSGKDCTMETDEMMRKDCMMKQDERMKKQ